MSSESSRLRLLPPLGPAVVLSVLLASLGCGLKGDPLPPIRPPEPVAEEVPAETEATDEETEDSDSAAGDSDDEEDGDSAQGAA
ncbi:MAG: hypothetical protein OXP74_09865 [Acidobacteriota bacterium]|nr:hypothetical protein [Acidobacteriota bacterium]